MKLISYPSPFISVGNTDHLRSLCAAECDIKGSCSCTQEQHNINGVSVAFKIQEATFYAQRHAHVVIAVKLTICTYFLGFHTSSCSSAALNFST